MLDDFGRFVMGGSKPRTFGSAPSDSEAEGPKDLPLTCTDHDLAADLAADLLIADVHVRGLLAKDIFTTVKAAYEMAYAYVEAGRSLRGETKDTAGPAEDNG